MMLHLSLKRIVARFLEVAEELIVAVQEWTNVFFVRFVKGSPLFLSKKIRKTNRQKYEEAKRWLSEPVNCPWYVRVWEKNGKERIYFNLSELLWPIPWQEAHAKGMKFYFDAEIGFASVNLSLQQIWECREFVSWLIP